MGITDLSALIFANCGQKNAAWAGLCGNQKGTAMPSDSVRYQQIARTFHVESLEFLNRIAQG